MTITITRKIKGYSVVSAATATPTEPATPNAAPAPAPADPDRRLVLGALPGIAERSLRFPKRPSEPGGFTAWTSDFIRAPGGKFVLCISHVTNGHQHPFEVWALGAEQPPATALICQLLSKVLQTDDRPFIWHHLAALKKATEVPFQITLPHGGATVTAPSVGAAIALIYEAHALHLGYAPNPDEADSPMLRAMSSIREPKSNGQGGYATFEDVVSPAGDDFPLFCKEVWIEGSTAPTPISVWAGSRRTPPESEAILKIVSLAMRHRDPAWIATCLETLRKHVEVGRELGFAGVGTRKPSYYHSTWAYVADLIRHRYEQLGVLDENGHPIQQGSLFEPPTDDSTLAASTGYTGTLQPSATDGMRCWECNLTSTLQLMGGCWTCTACGASKCS